MSRKKFDNTEDFSGRLSKLMSYVGFGDRKQTRFAEEVGVSPSFLSDVLNKKSGPSYGLIYGIAKLYTNVNIIWLMTGDGELFLNQPPKIDQNSTTPVDDAILEQVIECVEIHLDKLKRTLKPEFKARLIMLLYDYFSKTGEKVDGGKVASYLKLVG